MTLPFIMSHHLIPQPPLPVTTLLNLFFPASPHTPHLVLVTTHLNEPSLMNKDFPT